MTIQINGTSGISGVDGSAATPALQGSDTNTGISFGADTVNLITGGVTRATTDASGYFRLSGSGIQFNGDTASANSLDDYEEGTWTPGFQLSSQVGSFTYSGSNGARYTKIGRVVHINGILEWTNHNLTSGSLLQLTGLPFSTAAGNPTRSGISISYASNTYTGITVYQHAIRSESGVNYMTFNYANATDGSIDNAVNYNQISTSGVFIFFGMYIV